MNVFCVYDCPKLSAIALDDVRLRKMIVESTQILCMAIHTNEYIKVKPEGIYKPYNVNESTCVWARESKYHFKWVAQHLVALLNEYYYRFDKSHDSYNVATIILPFEDYFPNVDFMGFNKQFNKKRDNYETLMNMEDIHKAYQIYLTEKWNEEKSEGKEVLWTRRNPPEFYK